VTVALVPLEALLISARHWDLHSPWHCPEWCCRPSEYSARPPNFLWMYSCKNLHSGAGAAGSIVNLQPSSPLSVAVHSTAKRCHRSNLQSVIIIAIVDETAVVDSDRTGALIIIYISANVICHYPLSPHSQEWRHRYSCGSVDFYFQACPHYRHQLRCHWPSHRSTNYNPKSIVKEQRCAANITCPRAIPTPWMVRECSRQWQMCFHQLWWRSSPGSRWTMYVSSIQMVPLSVGWLAPARAASNAVILV